MFQSAMTSLGLGTDVLDSLTFGPAVARNIRIGGGGFRTPSRDGAVRWLAGSGCAVPLRLAVEWPRAALHQLYAPAAVLDAHLLRRGSRQRNRAHGLRANDLPTPATT